MSANMGFFKSSEPVEGKSLPSGMSAKQAKQLQRLASEMRESGLHVVIGVTDGKSRLFSIIQSDSQMLNVMLLEIVNAVEDVCPCPEWPGQAGRQRRESELMSIPLAIFLLIVVVLIVIIVQNLREIHEMRRQERRLFDRPAVVMPTCRERFERAKAAYLEDPNVVTSRELDDCEQALILNGWENSS